MSGAAPRLLDRLRAAAPGDDARLSAPEGVVAFARLLSETTLSPPRAFFAGKSVLIAARRQLAAAAALIELDGVAARLVLCPPDFTQERLASVVEQAKINIALCDDEGLFHASVAQARCGLPLRATAGAVRNVDTQWALPTSGTTGAPKLVAHSLPGLIGAIRAMTTPTPVWATFYDIRRYGGLQIFLRAATSGATLVLSAPDEPLQEHLARCVDAGVTHMSGTPSHWRKLLMSPHAAMIAPRYVRLSGEIADQAVLDALRPAFPHAEIVHAYASTEAGVGFEVTDGREGFPARFIGDRDGMALRVVDGSLRIRSDRAAAAYIGRDDLALRDEEGFVDTDDRVELRGDRYYFKGRGAGVINIGGLKVHPEEVEQVINSHAAVRMSLVKGRRSPIVGDLVVADVVLKEAEGGAALKEELMALCRAQLPRHMAPAAISFVPALEMGASGKLARRHV
jgi:acyl-coenzyme A synthetase/AMP-(fatty) acid ligase